MKTPKFKLSSSLLFSLIFLTPLIALTDLAQAKNINSHTSVASEIENINKSQIDFSQNLGQKIENEFLIAKPKRPQFRLFDNGPTFVESRPKFWDDSQPENISALQTFESLLG